MKTLSGRPGLVRVELSQFLRHGTILEPHIIGQAAAERRRILAFDQWAQIGAARVGNVEAVGRNEFRGILRFDVGDILQERPRFPRYREDQTCGLWSA